MDDIYNIDVIEIVFSYEFVKKKLLFWTWFAGEYAIEKLIDCQLGIENGVGFLLIFLFIFLILLYSVVAN